MKSVDFDPNDFVVVLAFHRLCGKCVNELLNISVTDFRVLSYVIAHDGTCRCSDISAALDLSRSSVSTSLHALEAKSLVSYPIRYGEHFASSTLSGRDGFEDARQAISRSIADDISGLLAAERATIDHLMVVIADRLGAPLMSGDGIDMVLVYLEVNSRVMRLMKKSVASSGLSVNEFLVLGEVASAPDGIRPSGLAQRLKLRRPAVTSACGGLSDEGLVTARTDIGDARSKVIAATSEGVEVFMRVLAGFWRDFSESVRTLTSDEFGFIRTVNARLCS